MVESFYEAKRWKKFVYRKVRLYKLDYLLSLDKRFQSFKHVLKEMPFLIAQEKPVPQSSIWNPLKLLKHVVSFIKVDQVVREESGV